MRRLRRRVALPILVLSLVASWLGAVAHAIGHWSILGTLSDGRYFVNAATLLLAATLAGAPVLGPGVCLRSRREEQRAQRVGDVASVAVRNLVVENS